MVVEHDALNLDARKVPEAQQINVQNTAVEYDALNLDA
jgi:hypothetical protein